MTSLFCRWCLPFGLLAGISSLFCSQLFGVGGEAKEIGGKKPRKPAVLYYGSATCGRCHNNAKDQFAKNKDYPTICRMTEMHVWQKQDKHKIAWEVLRSPRAQRMGKLLNIENVMEAKACVSCHGVYIGKEHEKFVDPFYRKKRISEGVSCVACHGHYGDWIKEHHGNDIYAWRQSWRKLTRAVKESKYGMTDLWHPPKRARLCASCHIGNVSAGKFVTHEMYAAGHPPLPSFETAVFSDQMPRHWEYLKEKKKGRRKWLQLAPLQAELERPHLLAVSSLVAVEQTMRNLAAQADRLWPDFAHFDCQACHHELRSKSWRQQRGFRGKPGRPALFSWPTALVDLGLYHAAAGDDAETRKLVELFWAKMKRLQDVLDSQPFGEGEQVKAEAKKSAAWIAQQIQRIHRNVVKNRYSQKTPLKMLSRLLQVRRETIPDYESARQIAWAYTVLAQELKSKNVIGWKELDQYMGLTFPQGQKRIDTTMDAALKRIHEYEPPRFFRLLDTLLKRSLSK